MKDQKIIDLYFARDEQAIVETDKQYGAACMRISLNILNSRPDAEECVSDTYISVWNNIPPTRPTALGAYICRIVRNLSVKRFRDLHRQKRNRDLEVVMEDLVNVAAPQRTEPPSLQRTFRTFLRPGISWIDCFLWDAIFTCARSRSWRPRVVLPPTPSRRASAEPAKGSEHISLKGGISHDEYHRI